MLINIVTYFLIVGPVSFFMAFKYGDHDFYGMVDLDNFEYLPLNLKRKYNGLGVAGLWIGVCTGFVF